MPYVRIAVFVAAAILALFVLVRFLEPRLAFFPLPGEDETPRDFGVEFESVTIETGDGERLRAWLLPHPAARAFVVYFHGNGGNLSMWAPILARVAREGYTVLAVDYRGYGASTGRPSERGLYRDVEATIAYVRDRVEPTLPVVYWGRSIGASMAAYAATRQRPAGVILESGFPDGRSLLRSSPPMAFLALFSSYRFPAARYMREAQVPALVLHGDADGIVPFDQGRALFEQIPEPKQFFVIQGGDHNDARPPDAAAYWKVVNAFVGGLT